MARIRTIKPEFWQDERIGLMPMAARLLYIGLWTIADDYGRLRGNPLFIRAQLFPYDNDIDVVGELDLLECTGRITRYRADGEHFIWVRRFNDHQRIDKPQESRLPPPPERSENVPGTLQDDSRLEGKGEEGKGSGKVVEGTAPPPAEPVQHLPRTVAAPTTDPDTWAAEDFWAWAQDRRCAGGLLSEKPVHNRKLSAWFSAALMTEGVTVDALKEGFYRFSDDEHWGKAKPPYPFAAFISQWDKYTHPEVRNGAPA